MLIDIITNTIATAMSMGQMASAYSRAWDMPSDSVMRIAAVKIFHITTDNMPSFSLYNSVFSKWGTMKCPTDRRAGTTKPNMTRLVWTVLMRPKTSQLIFPRRSGATNSMAPINP